MHACLLLHAPLVFNAAWRILRALLPPPLQRLFVFVNSGASGIEAWVGSDLLAAVQAPVPLRASPLLAQQTLATLGSTTVAELRRGRGIECALAPPVEGTPAERVWAQPGAGAHGAPHHVAGAGHPGARVPHHAVGEPAIGAHGEPHHIAGAERALAQPGAGVPHHAVGEPSTAQRRRDVVSSAGGGEGGGDRGSGNGCGGEGGGGDGGGDEGGGEGGGRDRGGTRGAVAADPPPVSARRAGSLPLEPAAVRARGPRQLTARYAEQLLDRASRVRTRNGAAERVEGRAAGAAEAPRLLRAARAHSAAGELSRAVEVVERA